MPRNVKTLGTKVVAQPGRQPFVQSLNAIERGRARTFTAVEPRFLKTMQDFDKLVQAGQTTQGDRQNGKGDFLNDVLALLLERCSGKKLHTRRNIPGLLFREPLARRRSSAHGHGRAHGRDEGHRHPEAPR